MLQYQFDFVVFNIPFGPPFTTRQPQTPIVRADLPLTANIRVGALSSYVADQLLIASKCFCMANENKRRNRYLYDFLFRFNCYLLYQELSVSI